MWIRKVAYAASLLAAYTIGTLTPLAITQTTPRQGTSVKRYMQVQYMKVKPGQTRSYQAVERDLWKPIHQERVNRGLINSWALYGVHLPGQQVDYQYVILTEFPSFSALEDAKYPELFEEVQGRSDYEEVLRETEASRDRIGQDILVLVDHTD